MTHHPAFDPADKTDSARRLTASLQPRRCERFDAERESEALEAGHNSKPDA